MKTHRRFARRKKTLAVPWNPWINLALQTGEMLAASAQVIGHRTHRIARAGAQPSLRDQSELMRMGQEKIEAAAESAQAMAGDLMTIYMKCGTLAFQQMLAGVSAVLSPPGSPSATKVMRGVLGANALFQPAVAASVVRCAQKGLRPVHSRATANARRLGKARKR